MDEQTGEKTLKTCWLIICFSIESHHGQKQERWILMYPALMYPKMRNWLYIVGFFNMYPPCTPTQ